MRVTAAFNRVLELPGAWVASVAFIDAGIVIGLRRRGRLLTCPCGRRTRYALRAGAERLDARYHTILAAAFDADRSMFATGSADKTARLWTTDPTQAAAYICATAGDPITRAEWNKYLPNLPYRPPCGS